MTCALCKQEITVLATACNDPLWGLAAHKECARNSEKYLVWDKAQHCYVHRDDVKEQLV
jgi:hypothetical protein